MLQQRETEDMLYIRIKNNDLEDAKYNHFLNKTDKPLRKRFHSNNETTQTFRCKKKRRNLNHKLHIGSEAEEGLLTGELSDEHAVGLEEGVHEFALVAGAVHRHHGVRPPAGGCV